MTEKDLSIDDLLGADEIFLTNVIMQVMPITKVENHTVGDGRVGDVTKKLQTSFNQLVKSECGKNK